MLVRKFTLALFDEQHDQIAVNDMFMMGIHSERIKLFLCWIDGLLFWVTHCHHNDMITLAFFHYVLEDASRRTRLFLPVASSSSLRFLVYATRSQ